MRRLIFLLVAMLFSVACTSDVPQASTPTPTSESTAESTPESTPTPTATPRAAVTVQPIFDGMIAGIRLGPEAVRGGAPECIDATPMRVRLADAVLSPLNPVPATLPEGAILDYWEVVECGEEVVAAEASFRLRGNRSLQIFRFRGEPVFRGEYPVNAVRRVTVRGRDGIGVSLHADGRSAIFIREPWGLTTIRASAINVDELAEIVFDLKPNHAAGLSPDTLAILDAASPGLTDVAVQVLAADAEQATRLMLPITALCSMHGELFEHCRLDGKTTTDTFVGHVLTGLLHCEGRVVPPDLLAESLSPLDDRGLLLTGVWRLDEEFKQLAGEALSPLEEASVEFALAFAAAGLPQWEVMFFVDPEADAPIRFTEIQSDGWTAADTVERIGSSWVPLAVDVTPPAGEPAVLHLSAEALRVLDTAIDGLAGWLGTDETTLSLDRIVRVEWPDGCLGEQRPGQSCTDGAVPGYHVRIFLGGEWSYQVRSNLDASRLVWFTDWIVEGTFAGVSLDRLLNIDGEFPDALDERHQQFVIMPGSDISLVESLRFGDPVLVAGDGRPSSDVPLMIWIERDPEIAPPGASDPDRIVAAAVHAMGVLLSTGGLELGSIEPAEWPDTCLGVQRRPSCASAIVPGFVVQVTHSSGASYEIRTDLAGSQFVWVGELAVEGVVNEVVVATTIGVEADTGERYRARVVDGSTIAGLASFDRVSRDERVKITLAPDPDGSGWVIVALDLAS